MGTHRGCSIRTPLPPPELSYKSIMGTHRGCSIRIPLPPPELSDKSIMGTHRGCPIRIPLPPPDIVRQANWVQIYIVSIGYSFYCKVYSPIHVSPGYIKAGGCLPPACLVSARFDRQKSCQTTKRSTQVSSARRPS